MDTFKKQAIEELIIESTGAIKELEEKLKRENITKAKFEIKEEMKDLYQHNTSDYDMYDNSYLQYIEECNRNIAEFNTSISREYSIIKQLDDMK